MGGLPGVDGSMRGSSIIFFMPASRVALSGHSTHEKATVSSAVAWTARRKSVTLPKGTSSTLIRLLIHAKVPTAPERREST
jgi:hypothetical protein